jgi:hypothetical protein
MHALPREERSRIEKEDSEKENTLHIPSHPHRTTPTPSFDRGALVKGPPALPSSFPLPLPCRGRGDTLAIWWRNHHSTVHHLLELGLKRHANKGQKWNDWSAAADFIWLVDGESPRHP